MAPSLTQSHKKKIKLSIGGTLVDLKSFIQVMNILYERLTHNTFLSGWHAKDWIVFFHLDPSAEMYLASLHLSLNRVLPSLELAYLP